MEHPYPAPAPATLTGIDQEHPRLVAWAEELRAVHGRLRDALQVVQGADADDLLLFCHGFCAALTGHHEGEDRHLLGGLQQAVDR